MNRSRVMLGMAIAASLCVADAYAGWKSTSTVYANDTFRTAYGNAGDARASSDTKQRIGCDLYQTGTTGENLAGSCHAQNSAGLFVSCYFPSAAVAGFAKVLAGQAANPYFYFTWDDSGTCTYLAVGSYSYYRPVTP